MIVIFAFSAQTGTASGGLSDAVARTVQRIFGGLIGWLDADDLRLAIRKAAHATEYLLLGALITCAWHVSARTPRVAKPALRRHAAWVWPLAIAVAYAASDEIHQLWVAGRSGRVTDVLIDATGAAIGVGLARLVMRRRNRQA